MSVSPTDAVHDLPDRAIRQSLLHAQHLQVLLQEAVPDLAANFVCERARLLDREFPFDDWRRREADLPFEIPYRLGDTEVLALVFVLIEHQSGLDQWMPLRTLVYAMMYYERVWKAWEEAPTPKPKVQLPPVLPIVLYTGPRPWGSNQALADLFAEPRAFHAFCPVWRPLFWNLAERTAEELLASASEWMQTLAVIRAEDAEAEEFRRVYNEAVRRLAAKAEREPVRIYDLLRIVLTWALWRRPPGEHPPLVLAAEEATVDVGWRREVKAMRHSMGQVLLDQGRNEGRNEGRSEGHQASLIEILIDRFGALPDDLRAKIEACTDVDKLRAAIRQSWRIESVDELTLPNTAPTIVRAASSR